ncbi:uncharacterized protein LOC127952096 [Carassius gibelio]|uniref:uncharacterized protein LOC127952096 n=1 Tax=Carassius gibelio TaxID=101364 RepID=UPI002279C2C2|nr:uncharacterized protein LOC127952096 [Carassius gibelio]
MAPKKAVRAGVPADIEVIPDGGEILTEDAAGAAGHMTEEESEDEVLELKQMFQRFMQDQQERDARQAQEAVRQETRWKSLQHQFRLFQGEVGQRTSLEDLQDRGAVEPKESSRASSGSHNRSHGYVLQEPKMQQLSESDDIEHYLTAFERIAEVCRWPREDWAIRLLPLLTGKARAAYVAMDVEDAIDYVQVKEAILKKYSINHETYRQRFRAMEVLEEETPKELYVRLKDLYQKWVRPAERTKQEIGEMIILEQFLRMLNPEVQTWIKEHSPSSAEEAARLADVFVAARRRAEPWSLSRWKTARDRSYRRPSTAFQGSRSANEASVTRTENFGASGVETIKCYKCGQLGHKKPMCPQLTKTLGNICYVPRETLPEPVNLPIPSQVIRTVELNGKKVTALIDTGCTQTLVESELVPELCASSDAPVIVRCVHGEERQYAVTDVYLGIAGQTYLMKVGLAQNLPYPVILGHDFPALMDLVPFQDSCNVVLTRAQSRQNECEKEENPLMFMPFFDSELSMNQCKVRKSRRERKQEKFKRTIVQARGLKEPEKLLNANQIPIPEDMRQLQKEDTEISKLYSEVVEAGGKGSKVVRFQGRSFCVRNDLLYRKTGDQIQMVLPVSVRHTVMTMGHSIPWAGHLGRRKTHSRIGKHFYWLGMSKDIAEFCKACPECQYSGIRQPHKVPLVPLPVIDVPFQRLGMDIVGPLERSKTGYKYMLVICDYATRFPEVFPLKNIKAKAIASCLVQLFSRVGIPKEILTDRGTNFTSQLLQQVYQLLGIKGLRTTPYHPETDGLVERFNQTLVQMLRKFVNEVGTDWDQWLPYLMFAYREVPQASTGFSPFQLMYGHEVQGPLSLVRELWEGNSETSTKTSVIDYVLAMRQKLQQMTEFASAHLTEIQRKQKTWYDRKTKSRSFEPGQKVLVMLPTSENKLLGKWQGPFEVTKKMGTTTYEIATPGQARAHRVLHINLLKEWYPQSESTVVNLVRLIEDEEEAEEQYLPGSQPSPPVDLNHLSVEQRAQIQQLCDPELFKSQPGYTTLIKHRIVLKENAQPKRMSYRIPERLLTAFENEVTLMQQMDIVEPSKSEWCNPVVLVPKKDNTLRFCIDFRYLNSVSKFDSYPMPRIEELTEKLGKAKFISTIDLSKGYWQVPLDLESRELTAFRTPRGLMHFRVLPFGLHGAPPTFQRLMDTVLDGLGEFAAAYLDDVVIFSTSWESHLHHLQTVFQRIKVAGLTINPAKCSLVKTETEYLGYTLGNGVIKPQVLKVGAIQSCPLPATKKQIRSFLGLVGWYRKFIPHFSTIAAPLTDLIKKTSPTKVQWTVPAEKAFLELKGMLSNEPVLRSPDFEKSFVLQTDASDLGLGAVLMQEENGGRHPVV